MASSAKAKAERFLSETCGSDLGTGDYSPAAMKPNSSGAVSLAFTSPKGPPNSLRKRASIEQDSDLSARLSAARLRLNNADVARRRSTIGGLRSASSTVASRIRKVEDLEQFRQQEVCACTATDSRLPRVISNGQVNQRIF